MKVFRYYESLGFVEMTKITLAGSQPNDPILTNIFMYQSSNPHKHLWANERVSVNDCFLRNMQKYKYIANIDNDGIPDDEDEDDDGDGIDDEDDLEGGERTYELGFGYGATWGSIVLIFASVVLLICDRESEEIFYKERQVEEEEEGEEEEA